MDEKTAKNINRPGKRETREEQKANHIMAESFNLDSLDIDKINKLSEDQQM